MTGGPRPTPEPGPADGVDPGTFLVVAPDPREKIPDFDRDGEDDDEPTPPSAALLDWVREAFAGAYEGRYLGWLAGELGVGVVDGDAPSEGPASRFPSLPVPLPGAEDSGDEDGGMEDVVFDGDLLAALIEFYVLDGWRPIEAIQAALDRELAKLPDTSGGGVVASPWRPAAWLFGIARNGLGLLVREELAGLEELAGIRTQSAIAESQTRFALLDGNLVFETITEEAGTDPNTGKPVTVRRRRLKDRSLADALYRTLSEAVTLRRSLDLRLAELARLNAHIRGSPTLSAAQGSGGPIAAAVAGARRDAEEAVRAARALANLSLTQATESCPLALLVFPSLSSPFEKDGMEEELDRQVSALRGELAKVGDTVRPKVPHTMAASPGIDVWRPAAWPILAEAVPPPGGIEIEVVGRAVAGLTGGGIDWFPLVSERTLHELVGAGTVERDGLTYAVYAAYTDALSRRLEEAARDEQADRDFWLAFSRMAAAASLVALVTPASAPGAPVLRGAAWVGDLILLARSIHSVRRELARIDQLRKQAIAEVGGDTVALFGELGELVAIRVELIEGLAEDAVITLLTTLAGAHIPLVRRALVAYSYLQDVQTLLVPDGIPD